MLGRTSDEVLAVSSGSEICNSKTEVFKIYLIKNTYCSILQARSALQCSK